jgi:hypothetical protein
LRRFEQGKKRAEEEACWGFIGEGLMAITARNYRGINSGRFQEREREVNPVKKNLTRGSHLSVLKRKIKEKNKAEQREGRGLRPVGLLLGLGPRVQPSWAVPFFFCSNSFFLISVL